MATATVSEARLRANRQNAQKSTGPRTPEGKAASRRNGTRHGLASSGTALPDGLAARVAERLPAWLGEFRPSGPVETWLVEQLVVASVQLEQAQEHGQAQDALGRARAAVSWDEDRWAEVEALGARLARDPARVGVALRRSARGCLWLVKRWEALGQALAESGGTWTEDQRRRALDLLGVAEELRASHPIAVEDDPAALAATVAEEVDELTGRFDSGLAALDVEHRALAAKGLALDSGPDARLARRYEAACSRRFDSLLARLSRLRAGRPDAPDADDGPATEAEILAPEPAPPDEPAGPPEPARAGATAAGARPGPDAGPTSTGPATLPIASSAARPAPHPNRRARRAERARLRQSKYG